MVALSKRWLAALGIGACAVCCAVPLAGLLGISLGVGSGFALWSWLRAEWLCGLLIVLGIGLFVLFVRSRSRARHNKTRCTESCAVDQSCCGTDSNADSTGCLKAPAGCSLSEDKFNQRLQTFKTLLAEHLIAFSQQEENLEWRLSNDTGVLAESQRLAALEQQCCSDLNFQVEQKGSEVVWTISAKDKKASSLKLFSQLPDLALGRT